MTSVISVLKMAHNFYLGNLGLRIVEINHVLPQKEYYYRFK